jgi:hypothetical protein
MTVTFSDEAMRAMGFRPFAADETIVASFRSVTVYEARGVTLEPGTRRVAAGTVSSASYRVAVSPGLNEGCLALLGDFFTEGEEEWKKENKCVGPFVLVQLGPTREHTSSAGRIKSEDDGSVTTYDSFPGVRGELAALEATALPAVLSAITCVLNEESRYVALCRITRASAGRTTTGQVVHDIHLEVRGTAHTSYRLPQDALASKLEQAVSLAPTLNPKASRFFALGLGEDDELKRFLYFFLALEVETHAVFARVDHSASLRTLLNSATPPRQSMALLLRRQIDQLKNLRDRFVWCAASVWINLSDDDIAHFERLKQARDAIAHGSRSEPPAGFARTAEQLARKLLSYGLRNSDT